MRQHGFCECGSQVGCSLERPSAEIEIFRGINREEIPKKQAEKFITLVRSVHAEIRKALDVKNSILAMEFSSVNS